MIGKRQRKELENFNYPGYRLEIVADKRYLNTRETGRGYRAMLRVVHIESGDIEYNIEMARCQSLETLEEKCKELRAFIATLPRQEAA